MRKPVPILVAILVVAVLWIFFKNFRVAGLDSLRVEPRPTAAGNPTVVSTIAKMTGSSAPAPSSPAPAPAAPADPLPKIRIATFNVQALDATKCRKAHVVDLLSRIARQFDVLALQEIQSETDDILPRLVQVMNKTGESFDYAVGPRVGPKGAEQQYGFIFNRRTVALDRSELYTVDDPDDLLAFEPFVGWFRTVGPAQGEAFTFSLVNVKLDPTTAVQERIYLVQLLSAVRQDGRDEDDLILAGDLQAGPGQLGALDEMPDMVFAVRNLPTDVNGLATWDNIAFQKTATGEFTGETGVLDFLRKYNLTIDEALEVSDHLPVFAEFQIYEGGQPGRVARQQSHATVR